MFEFLTVINIFIPIFCFFPAGTLQQWVYYSSFD